MRRKCRWETSGDTRHLLQIKEDMSDIPKNAPASEEKEEEGASGGDSDSRAGPLLFVCFLVFAFFFVFACDMKHTFFFFFCFLFLLLLLF